MQPIVNKINSATTLFLDRDGVINIEKQNDYIYNWDEFIFYPGTFAAFAIFAKIFRRIVVVTNQKGVGKGLMPLKALLHIHQNMQAEIEKNGGRIHQIHFCTELEDTHPMRKPQPGMGLAAAQADEAIELCNAIMVGNRLSDMEFGKNIGANTVFLTTTHPNTNLNHPNIDYSYSSLATFANAIAYANQ
jgi:D-glycero-D-manno-heptose 1,7-bisphosphate phosphatase